MDELNFCSRILDARQSVPDQVEQFDDRFQDIETLGSEEIAEAYSSEIQEPTSHDS
jgi:hypothetical protein